MVIYWSFWSETDKSHVEIYYIILFDIGSFQLLPVWEIILFGRWAVNVSLLVIWDELLYVTQAKETLRKSFESILFIYQSICLQYSFGVLRGNIELED